MKYATRNHHSVDLSDDKPPTNDGIISMPSDERRWLIKSSICDYNQTSNISRTLTGDKIVDHSDVVGASPVGATPTTWTTSSDLYSRLNTWCQWLGHGQLQVETRNIYKFWDLVLLMLEVWQYMPSKVACDENISYTPDCIDRSTLIRVRSV